MSSPTENTPDHTPGNTPDHTPDSTAPPPTTAAPAPSPQNPSPQNPSSRTPSHRTPAPHTAAAAATADAATGGSTAITNIGQLVTNDPSLGTGPLGLIEHAAVVIEGDRIVWAGTSSRAPATDSHHDAGGRAAVPGFVDPHSHLLFAGDRTHEFNARMSGRPYTAGGIRTTVAATRQADDDELAANLARRLYEMLRQGTTTAETKSGYGLTTADEARALRIAAAHTDEVTYLGAHIVAPEYTETPDTYVALVTGPMLDACAPYARWIDVFCEKGAFDGDQARAVLTAGRRRGLIPRIHANQLSYGPGVQLAVELAAASADHCTHLTDDDVDALAQAARAAEPTVATLLPGCEFSTRAVYPDARRLLDAGATVAISTDCNPGSSFTSSMPFCVAIAVREMGMTPDEALWSATAGGAAALRRTDIGRITPGARADLVLLDAPSHVHLAYRPGVPLVTDVWQAGRRRYTAPPDGTP